MEVLEDDEQREAQQQQMMMQMFAAVHGHSAAAAPAGPGVAWEDGVPDIDDYVYQIVFFDGATEWELLAECTDPTIERLLMWLYACEVLYLVQEYELSCSTPGAWFAELDVYCNEPEEKFKIRFRLAKEFAKEDNSPDNSPAAQ
eukprot:s114_g46.t1